MAKKRKIKPLSAGFKRSLKIIFGMIGIAVLILLAVMYMATSSNEGEVIESNLGRAPHGRVDEDIVLSDETRQRLDRVHTAEAEQARQQGRSYIPETFIVGGTPIEIDVEDTPPPPQRVSVTRQPTPNSPGQPVYNQYVQEQYRNQLEHLEQGLERQLSAVLAAMTPATVVNVDIAPLSRDENGDEGNGSGAGGGQDGNNQGLEIIGGDEIVAAQLMTPINTDTSRFVLAEIVSGHLSGATLRGQVIPMTQTGDIEDVGIRFSSMRWNNQFFQIDAIALNEQTATDAMNGKVNRRFISRHVMPVLVAGLTGASTYFTARGTPSTSLATSTYQGESAIIVDQDKASREEARQQGIGDAIDKAANNLGRETDRAASRPNQVTVEAYTPIGVIFNAPVYTNQAN